MLEDEGSQSCTLGVKNPDAVRDEILDAYDIKQSWREVSRMKPYRKIGISAGTLCTIAKTGYIPEKWRVPLGMTELVKVEVCPRCGIAHTYDCATQRVAAKRNGGKRRPRPSYKRLWQQSLLVLAAMSQFIEQE